MIPHTLFSTHLVLLTPCFCAGAYQNQAELRTTSFRGELRWWFRCLGGTHEQEARVFGSVAGKAIGSAVSLHLKDIQKRGNYGWVYQPTTGKKEPKNSSYIIYPLADGHERSRAYLAPGTTFTLELCLRRPFTDPADSELLQLAWDCLCNLGAIGLRSTRALGAFAPAEPEARHAEALLAHPTFTKTFGKSRVLAKNYGDYRQPDTTRTLLTDAARRLNDYRTEHGLRGVSKQNGGNAYHGPSVFGNAERDKRSSEKLTSWRQRSALRFRPILTAEETLKLCIFKAPNSTLGEAARRHTISDF